MCKTLLFVFLGLQAFGIHCWADSMCKGLFLPVELTWSSRLGFSQDFIGREWGNHKLRKLIQTYEASKGEHRLNEADFVLQYTEKKPLQTIRDIDGRLRLIDDHHKFYAYVLFVGSKSDGFRLHVKVLRDYSQGHRDEGPVWTEAEMMKDLRQNSHILIYNNLSPTLADLRSLSSSIVDMPDMPARSIMGFVLSSLSTPLKGSDFTKMIQFKLYNRMVEAGIDVEGKHPYSTDNIHRLRDLILSSPELLKFLRERINPKLSDSRKQEVTDFLTQTL